MKRTQSQLYQEYPPILLEKWRNEDETNIINELNQRLDNRKVKQKPRKIGYRMYLIYKQHLKNMFIKEKEYNKGIVKYK